MPELLVQIVDHGDAVDALKAGHVIVACPDGHEWSSEERNNQEWIILSTNLLESEIDALTTPPYRGDALPSNVILPARSYKLDLSGFTGSFFSRANDLNRVIQCPQ